VKRRSLLQLGSAALASAAAAKAQDDDGAPGCCSTCGSDQFARIEVFPGARMDNVLCRCIPCGNAFFILEPYRTGGGGRGGR
jgi:hypothetical protein